MINFGFIFLCPSSHPNPLKSQKVFTINKGYNQHQINLEIFSEDRKLNGIGLIRVEEPISLNDAQEETIRNVHSKSRFKDVHS